MQPFHIMAYTYHQHQNLLALAENHSILIKSMDEDINKSDHEV